MILTLQRRNNFKHYIEEDDTIYYTEQNVNITPEEDDFNITKKK